MLISICSIKQYRGRCSLYKKAVNCGRIALSCLTMYCLCVQLFLQISFSFWKNSVLWSAVWCDLLILYLLSGPLDVLGPLWISNSSWSSDCFAKLCTPVSQRPHIPFWFSFCLIHKLSAPPNQWLSCEYLNPQWTDVLLLGLCTPKKVTANVRKQHIMTFWPTTRGSQFGPHPALCSWWTIIL